MWRSPNSDAFQPPERLVRRRGPYRGRLINNIRSRTIRPSPSNWNWELGFELVVDGTGGGRRRRPMREDRGLPFFAVLVLVSSCAQLRVGRKKERGVNVRRAQGRRSRLRYSFHPMLHKSHREPSSVGQGRTVPRRPGVVPSRSRRLRPSHLRSRIVCFRKDRVFRPRMYDANEPFLDARALDQRGRHLASRSTRHHPVSPTFDLRDNALLIASFSGSAASHRTAKKLPSRLPCANARPPSRMRRRPAGSDA